jgi:hypothetical protein
MNREFTITYLNPYHIAKIMQNGGLKQLEKDWQPTFGKPVVAEKKDDGTIFVSVKGRKRFNAKTR